MDERRKIDGVLLGLFMGSGCSALIYEVVWFQQLGLVLGATALSLAVLLSSFMGGMCLGSLALPKFVSARWHPLRVYAVLELLIAGCGLLILVMLPVVGRVYWWFGDPGNADLPLRMLIAVLVLLPPTVFMGATLPAMSRWIAAKRDGLSRLGLFYGANTFGAVLGSLLSGLWLLRLFDVTMATIAAAFVNVAVALIALRLADKLPHVVAEPALSDSTEPVRTRPRLVYFSIAVSGATALGCEVVWTRLLALEFGPTVYTFSILLAVFLFGLGIGSSVGARVARRGRSPELSLATAQLGLMLAIPFSAWMMFEVLPYWLASRDPGQPLWIRMLCDIVRASAAFFPATCLWGASFPLAVSAAAFEADAGNVVGKVYAANTFGAVVGALAVSLGLVPFAGGQFAQQVLTCLSGCAGVLLLSALVLPQIRRRNLNLVEDRGWRIRGAVLLILVAVCPLMPRLVPAVPPGLLAWGRTVERWNTTKKYHFICEGLDSCVVVAESLEGNCCFHISGKVEATTSLSDMRTQRLLGHLPVMAHGGPRKVLVIGCGSGMTAGALLQHSTVEEVVLCEIEPCVIQASRVFFAEQNFGVLDDPRTRIVIDDARHFLATTRETFDIITADPIHPWVRGAASLYTAEFYDLCKKRLNPGGWVTQWVPLYESNPVAVKCELATFLAAFPQTTLWSGQGNNNGYDLVVLGTTDASAMDPTRKAREMFYNSKLLPSLKELGLGSLQDWQHRYVANGSDVAELLGDAEINRDGNLRLQYLAGLTPESQTAQGILRLLARSRRGVFPSTDNRRLLGN